MRIIITFLICVFLTVPALAGQNSCKKQHCVGVIDVGSTGSRLFFYAYNRDKDGYPIEIEEQWSKKVTPGLASLELNQATIDAYFDELFSTADTKIPVHVYATAGMRLLPELKQQSYYRAVRHWFEAHSEAATLVDVKTITGKEEGVYGWLAVNYKLNHFKDESTNQVGVMDMGGASVQIAFPVSHASTYQPTQEVSLYGKTYHLYVYSALGLGQTLVTQQFLNHAPCYPNNYPLADKGLALGNVTSCVKDVTHLINDVHHVADEVSSIVAQSDKNWYAMGGVAYLAQSKLFGLHRGFSPEQLLRIAEQKACARDWSEVWAEAPDGGEFACLMGAYYYALMVEGYGISTQKTLNLMPNDTGWTLGVVLSL